MGRRSKEGERRTISLSTHPLTWQQQSQLNSVATRFLDFLFLSPLLFHSPDLGMVERRKFAHLNCIGLLEGRLRTVCGVILPDDGTVWREPLKPTVEHILVHTPRITYVILWSVGIIPRHKAGLLIIPNRKYFSLTDAEYAAVTLYAYACEVQQAIHELCVFQQSRRDGTRRT